MAKRRKSTPTKRRSPRRRMSGIGSASINGALMTIAGAVAGQALTKLLPDSIDEKIRNAAPLALGFFLPKFVKGPTGLSLAAGMMAIGGVRTVQSFGLLNGIGDVLLSSDMMKVPMIARVNDHRYLGGVNYDRQVPNIAGIADMKC